MTAIANISTESSTQVINLDLPIDVLQAAILFASKEDVRFYLCGIALNNGHIVATDGHRMFWMPWQLNNLNLIISRDAILSVIAKWKKIAKKERPTYVQLSSASNGQWIINIVNGGSEIFAPIDAKYPEWQRVAKGTPEPQPLDKRETSEIVFNWDYLADAKKASLLIYGKTPVLLQTNPCLGAHIVFNSEAHPNAKALIMPMRV